MNVLDIAKWFIIKNDDIRKKGECGNIKLQVLLYYAQAICIAVYGHTLFANKIEAWSCDPIIKEVYRYNFDVFYQQQTVKIPKDIEKLLKIINSMYGFQTSNGLVNLIKEEEPWAELKEQAENKLNPEITVERIKEYYYSFKDIFEGYYNYDFDNETAEYINGNVFVYNAKETKLTDKDIDIIYRSSKYVKDKSFFVYKREEELIIY
jgi:uncharacterized phage-associated protein